MTALFALKRPKGVEMDAAPLQVSGQVTLEAVDQGSKSERNAVVLKADSGRTYFLRRQGGPAFGDHQLDELVGRRIAAEGVEFGRTLIMRDWTPDPNR